MRHWLRSTPPIICLLGLATANIVSAKDTDEAIAFFENKIRPVLVQHCYDCHSSDAKQLKGGLLLDSRQGALVGGDSGAAVVPRNPDESLLLSAIRYEDYEMPPKGQLPDAVITDFEKWIRMGATDPREGKAIIRREIDIEAGRDFWAFQPVQETPAPEIDRSDWPKGDVDRFVLAQLEQAGITPINDASKATWLRRVTFDLTGLPPSTDALKAFLADNSSQAKEKVVDRLLDSRHFGERWGRHWLDVARYAESTGRTRNYPFPFAWRYRDYVIKSLNEDKPYDQFIVEQIAGDLLPTDRPQQLDELLIATGYLALGSPDLNERDVKVYQMDVIADQIDTISRSMLGLTVGCARCHDHKFDPIPTDDYYALAGIFKSTQLLNGYANRVGGGNKARGDLLIPLGEKRTTKTTRPQADGVQLDNKKTARLAKAQQQRDVAAKKVAQIRKNKSLDGKARNAQLATAKRQLANKTQQLKKLRQKFGNDGSAKLEGPACLGVRDAKEIVNCRINIRGDTRNLGNEVDRGFLQVVGRERQALSNNQSGRLELAYWIANPDNPLTARVYVNRVWHQLFGKGLVRTVDNFGAMGARPTHPKLLDYLASQFVNDGWSVKQLIQNLVLTRTYGLDVTQDATNAALDSDNALLWRMNSRRLDFEAIRDAMLFVSGELQTTPGSGSPVESLPISELTKQKIGFDYHEFKHRSVYLPVLRSLLPDEMTYFDFPDPSETRGQRDVTIVPTQSLFLLNSDFVIKLAEATASQLLSEFEADDDIAGQAYRRLLSREASEHEISRLVYYANGVEELQTPTPDRSKQHTLQEQGQQTVREAAWSEVIHAMFAGAEFRYR